MPASPFRICCVCALVSLLTGCVSLGSSPQPAGLGAEDTARLSIKDDWTAEPPPPAPQVKQAPPLPQPKPVVTAPRIKEAKPAPVRKPAAAPLSSCGSDAQCALLLKAMVEDPTRKWIGQSVTPVEYANGTRLFAYKALVRQLTCTEIAMALLEIDAADKVFRNAVPGVTPTQAKRVAALNREVGSELRVEQAGRCKPS